MQVEVSDKRNERRLRPRGMSCNLGQVVDLSADGMRLLSRRQMRGVQSLVLTTMDSQPLRIRARVMWHRRHAAGEHVHGIRFERITPAQREQVHQLVERISTGLPVPRPAGLQGYGWMGLVMGLASLALTAVALAWTRFNPQIESAAPDLHRWLSVVPELGALLGIAAGGCAVLAIVQRITARTYAAKPEDDLLASTSPLSRRFPAQSELDRMQRSQSVLNCILESSLGGVVVLETLRDMDKQIEGFQIQLVNPAAEKLMGKNERVLVGQSIEQMLPCLTEHELYSDLMRIVEDGQPVQKEYQVGDDGRWYLIAMVQLADGIAVTFLDNTESRLQQEQLQHIAYHDELTGLPNRKALIEHVDSALSRTQRTIGHRSALLFLDFDRFKHVNDTLGHEAGDKLLIGIAQRLRENLRESDSVGMGPCEHIPARLGGDEFVVLLDGITGTEDAIAVAQRLLKVFARPHDIAGQDVVSTASIGIAINDGKYDSADDILRDADAAMYTAKQSGKGRYVLFDQDMQDKVIAQLRLEQDLRHAIDRDQFRLVYEPVIDLETGRTAGFEALLRWTHPEHGPIAPDVFIPLAEDLNLIGMIGEWVVRQGCAQLAEWRQHGAKDVFLNVNLSRGQLYEPNLADMMREQIEAFGLEPGVLRAELTETMVMSDLDFMAEKLTELKKLGLGLALDDFGTGYSSLSVLYKLPFDTLKIDRAFLEDTSMGKGAEHARRSSAIISAITDLAEHLQLDVIAEGIARPEQVATLQTLACRYAQGWHFSKPLDADDALKMLLNPAAHTGSLANQLIA